MAERIVKRGGEVLLPAEIAEKDALMPSLDAAIIAAMSEVTR